MIIKNKEGILFELTHKEYMEFLVQACLHFQDNQTLEMRILKDSRYEAAEMLLKTVADHRNSMSNETKEKYFATAHELIDQYKNTNTLEKISVKTK